MRGSNYCWSQVGLCLGRPFCRDPSCQAQINTAHYGEPGPDPLDTHGLASSHVAGSTLLDESIAKIRAQLEGVVAEESRERKLTLLGQLPRCRWPPGGRCV